MAATDTSDGAKIVLFGRTYGKAFIRLSFLADQIAFSGGNFLLTVMLARFFKPEELAAYGVGLSLALTILSVQRNCYLVQNELTRPPLMRKRARHAMGQHYALSGVMLIGFLLWTGGLYAFHASYYSRMTAWMAIITYFIYSQLGFDRMLMVKHESYLVPLIASGLFAVMICVLLGCAMFFHISYATVMLALFGYSAVKAAWLVVQMGWPDFELGAPLAYRAMKRYLVASLLGLAGSTGFNQVPLIVLGAISPLQSAALVAMRSLTQPLQIVVRSLDIIDKNFFHHKPVMTPVDLRNMFLRQTAVYVGLSLFVLLVMAVFGPLIVHLAYGDRYGGYQTLLVLTTIAAGLLSVSFPVETGVVKVKRLNRFNVYRIGAGVVGAGLALLLCKPYGANGAIIATLAGWVVSLASALWLMRDFLAARPVEAA